ncbi:MAG TPA: hypothetical protein PLO74_04870, partial [Thermotogota bacterium]|nr:hypothetical protein [Thermotogota bacterium]
LRHISSIFFQATFLSQGRPLKLELSFETPFGNIPKIIPQTPGFNADNYLKELLLCKQKIEQR